MKQGFFKKTGTLIDNCFKTFVDNLFIKRSQLTTGEKKTLFLSLPYLGEISSQTKTKLKKSFEVLIISCKFKLFLKTKGNPQMFSVLKISYLLI